ncbi:MAG TPA: GNAT family N-acetyltransferase, partial [Solirubrobacteraceae bacterium]|nr:GNAT family N-acetyltransferase [Solirubrobacteraceae bacterium]
MGIATGAVDIALRDGSTLRLRPLAPDDEDALREFLDGLDEDARAMRFFGGGVSTRAAAHDAAASTRPGRRDLVAVAGDDRTILAHACAVPAGAEDAEVAFAVAARLRGEGVATTMLAHLAAAMRAEGVERLTAVVLPGNGAMLEVFRESGLRPEVRVEAGEVHVSMPSELGPDARARYDERDATAAAAAVAHVLAPSSVAIVGASERRGSIGGAVLRNALAAGFAGELHVVNRHGGTICGLPAVQRVTDVDGPVELAVISVPAASVIDVARDCAVKGVRALVVLSDGFGEAGGAGRERQRELLEVCRRAGMRLVGPNCLGVIDTAADVRLNASFAPQAPPPGRVAFLSQSGALGIAVIDVVRERGLGLSAFVSVGDKADLSGNDFLSYWERDDGTDVVLLYLESFGNPRKFSRVARRVARSKPVVAVKGGRSAAGARAAGSHTGALLGQSDASVQALFREAGVVPTDTLSEMFDVAALLAAQRPPRGPRVGIVSNGGGLGILCADACAAAGLEVVAFGDGLRERLAREAPEGAALANPVDVLAAATPEHFERVVRAIGESGEVDALIAIYVPPMVSDPAEVARAIRAGSGAVPVAAVMAMADAPFDALEDGGVRVPAYRFP